MSRKDRLSRKECELLGLEYVVEKEEWKEREVDMDGVMEEVLLMGDKEYVEWLWRRRWSDVV
jgi:hypothetical protein